MSESNGLDTGSVAPATPPPSVPSTQPDVSSSSQLKTKPTTDTPETLAAMKKSAQQKFDEATRAREEAKTMRAEAEKLRHEALNSKSQIEQFIELTKTNPRKLEQIYGKEVAKKIAEDLLFAFYEEEKLTPQQLAQRQAREAEATELAELRAERKKRQDDEVKTKRESLITEQATEIDTQISTSIKEHGLTPTPKLVKRMAEYLEAQLDAGEELDPARVVAKVHEELHNDVVGYVKDMPIEQLISEFPTLVKRIREFDMKANEAVPNFQSGFAKPKTETNAKHPVTKDVKSIDEFFKSIG